MKLFAKIAALFSAPPTLVVPPPLYSDAEFLEVVMKHARQKTRSEEVTRATTTSKVLPKSIN